MRRFLLLLVVIPILVLGCTSTNDSYLIKSLDNEAKSDALTKQGIEEYTVHLVNLQEFDQIPRIKEYFTTALSFDPTNEEAQQYVDKIDNFKNEKFKASMATANKVLAKPKPTDDDVYQLAVSLQTAAKIDPKNADVQKALTDTEQQRATLVQTYMDKSTAALKGIDEKTAVATREKQYIEAYQNAQKALTVDPSNKAAKAQVDATKAELAKMVQARVAAIQKLITAASFTEARTQLTALSDMNKKLGNAYDAEVKNATYSLNFAWAGSLFTKKDYATANTRIDAAIAARKTDEAVSLRKKILDARAQADASVSFDTVLKEIDKLIASGDLVAAHVKINALWKSTKEQAKLNALDDRNQAITAQLKDLYDQGVKAYHDEDFKTAIAKLQVVVGVQVDYEQASDYLDKAKSKQKVLDQIGG
jgi:hypothetical protein